MSSRHISNALITLIVNDTMVEGVENVRSVVFHHFESHFKAGNMNRPGVDNLNFKSLGGLNRGDLVKPFFLEEVK